MIEVRLPATENHPPLRLVIPGTGEDGGTLWVRLPGHHEAAWYLSADELIQLNDLFRSKDGLA